MNEYMPGRAGSGFAGKKGIIILFSFSLLILLILPAGAIISSSATDCEVDEDCEAYFSWCRCSWVCAKENPDKGKICPLGCPSDVDVSSKPECSCADGECVFTNVKEGDLIKISTSSVVYFYDGYVRQVFPDEQTYFSWYRKFGEVKIISQASMEAISLGDNVVVRAGTKLVKITTDPKVYAVSPYGILHHIDSEVRATTLYGADWAQRVVDVPDAFFTDYTIGDPINEDKHPEGSLIKYADADDIYYINDAGEKRKFTSIAAFDANRFDFSNILTISEILTYSDGDDIAGLEKHLSAPFSWRFFALFCPAPDEWVNCMPVLIPEAAEYCQWVEENCPGAHIAY